MWAIGFLVFLVSLEAGICSSILTVQPVIEQRALQTTEKPVETTKQNLVIKPPKEDLEAKLSDITQEAHEQVFILKAVAAVASLFPAQIASRSAHALPNAPTPPIAPTAPEAPELPNAPVKLIAPAPPNALAPPNAPTPPKAPAPPNVPPESETNK